MDADQAVAVDVTMMRKAYTEVLSGYRAERGDDLDTKCRRLTDHAGLLFSELVGLAPRMRGTYRDTAVDLVATANRILADAREPAWRRPPGTCMTSRRSSRRC
ncbi:hypothetical protein AB0F03_37460 [Streptomyces sp. NPDC028722]|uniref:hypothetical protein n=1 Tax=Streptomyces sp. NPDC028722 TaxID=3155016 RepID=UPI0034074E88